VTLRPVVRPGEDRNAETSPTFELYEVDAAPGRQAERGSQLPHPALSRRAPGPLRPVVRPGEDRNTVTGGASAVSKRLRPVVRPGEDRNQALAVCSEQLTSGCCARACELSSLRSPSLRSGER
jgi:hypothetical protein